MRALTYLMLTRIKNRFLELRRKPAKLVLYLGFIGLLAFTMVTAVGRELGADLRDPQELYAILLGYFAMIYIMGILPGLGSGATFYTFSDVNMLFPAPISPKRILAYGLIRQMGTAIFSGVFLLFWYNWLRGSYGISFAQLMMIILGFALVTFSAQLTAMWIYCISSSSDKRKRIIRGVIFGVSALALLWVLFPILGGVRDGALAVIVERAADPVLMAFPVVGWISALVRGVLTGDTLPLTLGALLVSGFLLILISAILRMRADYYEDVLLATETTHSAIAAAKEGRIQEAGRREVKLGKTGPFRGRGASVFFFKHLRESRRGGRLFFDTFTLVFMAIPVAIAFFLGAGGFQTFLIISCVLMFFSIWTARWIRELTRPYIYLVPQSPFKKLVMACGESIFKCAIESVIIMVAAGLLTAASGVEIALGILIRIGLSLVFIAASAAIERLFGGVRMPGLVLLIYFVFFALLVGPGVVLSVVIPTLLGAPFAVALAAAILWIYGISFLVIFLCRNMLTWAELNY